ncbi:MAG TPA: rhomboid family intramembrane serine protease [Muricauda sp.]|uniref:Rhomboid family intramembrane serine protease n=1 Tax=Flagellimonas aurea TaxID=2915619 RepID=A0ABS3G9Z0_9FLAO|nr:rhomboid family intramembrane serine protease [Allomuricauda aurea]MBC74047.1 rhomboid family intramembrane serine protease [Allomuricauda sp.]MBO0355661.1 rhomboid family intramembrane serine protease [Allomuricauda aurea]UBZ13890.1 rhomboid family intramembrane serine protease [Allomuricauda aquimarina]HBU78981.1 rhomboid family intramembrane serine protease [Allomuricauda sp.]|tara:strand:- start:1481 stop:2131 length:651 start_codon:yes stop_codon:yes gene_type:complete
MLNLHIATIAIMAANVLVSLRGFNNNTFFDRYKFSISAIQAGQKERMLTSGFLHVDISHLFLNMFTLYFFAPVVISWFGSIKFLIIYLVSLIAGSLLALVFHKDEPYYSAVGASGAVMGVLYAAILLNPDMQLGIMFIPIPLPAYVLGIAYLLYSIWGMKSRMGNIGHTAHFGGAIGGYATTLLFMPGLFVTDTLIVILLAIPIIVLFVLDKMGKL